MNENIDAGTRRGVQSFDASQPARRRFLQQAVAAGGAGVLLYLAGEAPGETQRSAPPAAGAAAGAAGYRLTGHIRSYYDSARG